MRFRVVITPAAEQDIAESFRFIYSRTPGNAERWLRQLLEAVKELEAFAGHGRARESDFLGVELRQKIFKSHRIVYSLDRKKKLVTVHYIRHGARRAVGEPEIEEE